MYHCLETSEPSHLPKMKTFKQFQEGLFDWLPKSRQRNPTPDEAKKSWQNIDPGFVRPGPPSDIKYNMPIIIDRMKSPRKPGESMSDYLKRTSVTA